MIEECGMDQISDYERSMSNSFFPELSTIQFTHKKELLSCQLFFQLFSSNHFKIFCTKSLMEHITYKTKPIVYEILPLDGVASVFIILFFSAFMLASTA